jgi:hypothetical protein
MHKPLLEYREHGAFAQRVDLNELVHERPWRKLGRAKMVRIAGVGNVFATACTS